MKLSALLPMMTTLPVMALPLMTLDQQFDLMEKGAITALDTRQFSLDGVTVTGWLDGDMPVIIAVPRLDEKGQDQGESRYFFKGGELFGVREPESRFGFEKGKLVAWLDETGKPQAYISKVSMQQREQWMKRRAAQLQRLFEPSAAERRTEAKDPAIEPRAIERSQWLCSERLQSLTAADKVVAGHVSATDTAVKGPVRILTPGGWQDLDMECKVQGYRVVSLTWHVSKPS
ncbi:hypothetical protein ACL00X_15225 [Aeromonas diversa]|uniref:hypothetical protein n=1 Tax=Aeromonas diversa TaxID=502790 RepID=UPI0039A0BA8C